jgi:hypothetical protein
VHDDLVASLRRDAPAEPEVDAAVASAGRAHSPRAPRHRRKDPAPSRRRTPVCARCAVPAPRPVTSCGCPRRSGTRRDSTSVCASPRVRAPLVLQDRWDAPTAIDLVREFGCTYALPRRFGPRR